MKNLYNKCSHGGTKNFGTLLFYQASKNLLVMLMLLAAMAFLPNSMYATANDVGNAIVFSGCIGPPPQPGPISGNQHPCYGTVQTYTVAQVTGASSYSWTTPFGWTGTTSTNSITVTVMNSSGFITVVAANSCGNSPAESLAVTVGHVPPQPGVITGPTSVCAGTTHTYSIAPVAGATSYTWTLPGGGWTGSSSTDSITVVAGNGGGNLIVHAINACGASAGRTLAITVVAAPNAPGPISGLTTVCAGSVVTYCINAVTGATAYNWTLPGGWTGSSTTTCITTTVGTTGGTITVDAVNSCGVSSVVTLTVSVISTLPVQPGPINGNATPCDSTVQTYFVVPVAGATSYIWTTPVGWTGTSTTNSIVVNVMTVSGTISVAAVNACGSGPARTLAVTVGGNSLSQPGPISGNISVCAGSTQTYTIAPVTGATSYIWTLPGGWSGTSAGTSITVTVGTTGGTITVVAHNSCGNSIARTLTVTVVSPPQQGPITGNANPCSGTSQTYSVSAVTGATYTWTLPAGWPGSSTINSITSSSIGTTSGYVKVQISDACGSVTDSLLVTVATTPAQPGPITGNVTMCHGTNQTYSITAVTGASSYVWTLPAGWAGSSTNTTINTTAGLSGGTISVRAVNACGSSALRTLTVVVDTGTLPQPGPISGNDTVCQGSTQTYTIAQVTGATGYTWTLPNGWVGNSTITSITLTVGASSGTITVIPINACGSGPARTLFITVMPLPAQPGQIIGNTSPCSGSTQHYYVAPVTGALGYTWTTPGGWTGSSTTDSITVTVGLNSGTIYVSAHNACGSGPVRTLAVTVINAPPEPGPIQGDSTPCAGTVQTYSIAPVAGATSYMWTLPNGWSGTSTTTSITTTVGTTGGTISVVACNACGCSPARTMTITVITAPVIGPIVGDTTPCQGSTQSYSVTNVPGTTYNWTLPGGWTGSSTTGSISTTVGTNSGNITVVASNACGSTYETLAVTVLHAPVIGPIVGDTTPCQGSTQTYSVNLVSGTTYQWTKPAGWIGSSNTNSITLTVSSNTGNITVSATNACGSSYASLTITNVATIAITGNPSSFNFCAQAAPTYEILMATAGFNSYVWSPSGGTSATATVSTAGTYTVSAVSNNGCTAIKTQGVTSNCALPTNIHVDSVGTVTWIQSQCAVSYILRISVHNLNNWTNYTINNTNTYTFSGLNQNSYDVEIMTNCTSNGNVNSGWSSIYTFTYPSPRMMETKAVNAMLPFNLYPNPANDEVTISFSTMDEGSYSIKLIDMLGREVKSETDKATNGDNAHILNLDGMAKGVYTVILQKGDNISKAKLVVE